jgi:uncharacterized protein (DUF433 family)
MEKDLIISDPQVMLGKPVIAGTRITVELVLEKLAAGKTVEQIHSRSQLHSLFGIRSK